MTYVYITAVFTAAVMITWVILECHEERIRKLEERK